MERYVISVLVNNHSGVLSRVAGLFSRRGYNIDSLTVGPTENSEVSRMTIVVMGDHTVLEQITKQLNKLIDVIHLEELQPGNGVSRELALIKVSADKGNRAPIIELADVFKAKIIDVAAKAMSMEITGDQDKINTFLELMEPFGILEMARTGIAAIERGSSTIMDNIPKD
jgi:acetolactate synthase-1/3 small subunit